MVGVRNRILKAGDVSPVHHCHGGYQLPNGLPEQNIVTVKAVHGGYADVTDEHGRDWHISTCCMEVPCDVWRQGRWIDHQTHPAGAKAFEMWLNHERAEMEVGGGPVNLSIVNTEPLL